MYNLTVATAHTFYVGSGQWLVHNAPSCSSLLTKLIDGLQPYAAQVNKALPQLQKTGTFQDAVSDFYKVLADYGIDPAAVKTLKNGDVLVVKVGEANTLIVRNTSGSLRGGLPVLEHQVNGEPVLKITYTP